MPQHDGIGKAEHLNIFGYLSHFLTRLPQLGDNPLVNELDKLMPWSDKLPSYCR
ncbi:MAG: hypothetical protein NC235_12650 [Clostridiales bacterium]|nr:hypothetical protein [Clostridiales bacterium]